MTAHFSAVSFLHTGGLFILQRAKRSNLNSFRRRNSALGRTCFIPTRPHLSQKNNAFGPNSPGNVNRVKISSAILQLGSALRSNDLGNEDQSYGLAQNALTLRPYRVSPVDILVIAALSAAFLLSSGRFQRLSRLHALFGILLFAVQSLLYYLRLQYIYFQFQKDSSHVQADVEQVAKRLEMNEQKLTAMVKDVMRNGISDLKATMQETGNAREGQESAHRKAVEEGISSVNSSVTELRETFVAQAREQAESQFSVEVETLRAKLKDSEKSVVALQIQVQSLERSLASSRTTIARARQDAEIAAEREMLLRADIVALSRRAEEANSIRERLFAAETRNAALEQSVLRGSRAQEDLRIKANDAERRFSSMSQVSNMLRETLLNIGKTFPTAGRLLFEDVGGRPMDVVEKDPRLLGRSSKSSYQTPTSERREPKQEEHEQVMSWPDNVLDSGSASDVGLPEDGGFGTDHFGPEEQSGAEDVHNKKHVESPFSSLRGAFREFPQIQNDEEEVNANEPQSAKVVPLSGDEGQGERRVREQKRDSLTNMTNNGSAVEAGPDGSPSDAHGVRTEHFDKDESSNGTSVLFHEKNVSLKETANNVSSSLSQNSDSSDFDSKSTTVSGNDTQPWQSARGNNVDVSPVIDPNRTSPGSGESHEGDLEQLLSEVRDLVKRGRRKDVGDIESSRFFYDAEQTLKTAPESLMHSVAWKAEYGSALIAWARRDLRGEYTENRLQQARGLLTNCVEEEPENEGCLFNLSLCLCLLASLQDTPVCEELYKEACIYYDRLADLSIKSRIVFFNAGLAYISRARLENSSESPDQTYVTEMYTKASFMFSSALELQPEDSKSRLYLDECQEKLKGE